MYSDQKGEWTKPPRTKPPGQKPREQLRENLYMGLLFGFFVLGLLKIGGPRCVTYFMDGPDANSVMIPVKSISRKMSFSILINTQQFNLSCEMVDQCGIFMSSRRENSTYICWFISL